MTTIAEISDAAKVLNETAAPRGVQFELGRTVDGGWHLRRDQHAPVFLGTTKQEAYLALQAFHDGFEFGLAAAEPVPA